MDSPTAERLSQLERSLRRTQRALSALVVLFACIVGLGAIQDPKQEPQDLHVRRIEAETVVIRSDQPGKAALLVVDDSAQEGRVASLIEPGSLFTTSKGRCISMRTSENGSVIEFFTKDRIKGDVLHSQIEIGCNPEGASVSLLAPDGRRRAALGSQTMTDRTTGAKVNQPESTLTLWGPDGKLLFVAPPQ